MQSLRSIFVIAFFVTAGCGLPTLDLRDQLDLHRVSFYDKLTTNPPRHKNFSPVPDRLTISRRQALAQWIQRAVRLSARHRRMRVDCPVSPSDRFEYSSNE